MNFDNQNVQGPDVSFYQDNNQTPQQIDFEKMRAAGATYVIIRAGQNEWIDPDFQRNWAAAKEAGLPRGSYWYFDSRVSPIKQAELFALLLRDDKPELDLWLDLEEHYGGPYTGYRHWKTFLNRLRQLMPGARIGIYTGFFYITGRIPPEEFAYFSQFLLWLAWYTKDASGNYAPFPEPVRIPAPWTECLFWQWGTPPWGIAWGCESIEIDMNLFDGPLEDFQRIYAIGGSPPMDHYYKVEPNVAGEYRSIRAHAYPNIKGARIGQIDPGNFAKCRTDDVFVYAQNVSDGNYTAQAGDRWLHVFDANGAPIDGWVAEIHLGRRYLNVEEIGEEVPPGEPTLPDLPYIITLGDDVTYEKQVITGTLKPK